jgi:nitrogen fixation protein FixH
MQKSAWRFFPLAILVFLLTVVAVDGGMIFAAVNSFPGAADDHAFDTGNKYNEILENAARQAKLGWQLNVKVVSNDIEVTLTDQNGEALPAASVEAIATHPVGPAQPTRFAFAPEGARYVAKSALPTPGQWDLGLTASVGEIKYRATRRVVVQ